jgi:putative transposase
LQLVEQHTIPKNDSRYAHLDAEAFASKNLWNAANYLVRQSFVFEHVYLDNVKVFHLIKSHQAYKALPAKVSNQVLIQLHKAWVAFFEAMEEWREHPEKFFGRPKLPKYKPKEQGRNLLVYEYKAISKRALKRGMISLTGLGDLVPTKQTRETIKQVRVAPRATHYVIEVVYERAEQQAELDPTLFASIDLGVNNLAALTSNAGDLPPLLINGRPLKAWNQEYNKQRAVLQKGLAKQNRFTSRKLEQLTDKRNRRIQHYLHVASRRIINVLVERRIGALIVGLNPLWKHQVEMGRRHNQQFVQIPHSRFLALLRYKAQLVGISVIVTEEAYTSKASFLDRDEIPPYDPRRTEPLHFSGRRVSRGMYQASGKRLINADVNGSLNIARKVFPTAFDGPGIGAAPAVRPRRLAV